jgi:hypothetical protein
MRAKEKAPLRMFEGSVTAVRKLNRALTESERIDQLVLTTLSLAFDEFVAECVDSDGKPKAPSRRALMRAKASLPPYCKQAFKKDEG